MSGIDLGRVAAWAREAGLTQLDGMTFAGHARTPEILERFAGIAYQAGRADEGEALLSRARRYDCAAFVMTADIPQESRLTSLAREIARLQREHAIGLRALKQAKREAKKATEQDKSNL